MDFDFPRPLADLCNLEHSALSSIFGAPGTGKTNLCLILSVDCIKNGGKVVYIDTEGGFSSERLKQISGSSKSDNILNSIILLEPKTFEEQGNAIRGLGKKEVDLVVLDSSVALYRLEHPEKEKGAKNISNSTPSRELSEHNRELSRQMSILSNLARDKKIPVVVTAHTYKNWDTGESEIVGGDPLKYWSKCLLFLEKTGKTGERKITIMKHRSEPEGKAVKFDIVEEGIKPSGFKIF